MTVIDWSRYQKCPVCFAAAGSACTTLSGLNAAGPVHVPAAQPHSTRQLRAGADRG